MKLFVFFLTLVFNINFLFARAGGGCLEKGTMVLTPSGYIPVEKLKVGDKIISNLNNISEIKNIYSSASDNFIELKACGKNISVTKYHPFMISKGTFKEADFLNKGDKIFIYIKTKKN
ncbi:MAG: Hint domain-containing protein [Elusimicrobiota bacterium]